MASFGLGFDVAAPPEISPENAYILNDIFPKTLSLMSLLSLHLLIRHNKNWRRHSQKTKKIAPLQGEISQKRFKSVTYSELKELQEKRQSEATKKVQNGVSNSLKVWLKIRFKIRPKIIIKSKEKI